MGIREMQSLVPRGTADRSIAIPEGADTLQSYIMKRTFSEGGAGTIFFKFHSSLLQVGMLECEARLTCHYHGGAASRARQCPVHRKQDVFVKLPAV